MVRVLALKAIDVEITFDEISTGDLLDELERRAMYGDTVAQAALNRKRAAKNYGRDATPPSTPFERDLVAQLCDGASLTAAQLAEKIDRPSGEVRIALDSLCKRGFVLAEKRRASAMTWRVNPQAAEQSV